VEIDLEQWCWRDAKVIEQCSKQILQFTEVGNWISVY